MPDRDELIRRLESMGAQRKEIAAIIGVSRARLWEILEQTPEQKARRDEHCRDWQRRTQYWRRYRPKRDGLKVCEVARIAGVHVETVRRWIRADKLKATNHAPNNGGSYRIDRKDLERFLACKKGEPCLPTVAEAAEICGVSEERILEWQRKGIIRCRSQAKVACFP